MLFFRNFNEFLVDGIAETNNSESFLDFKVLTQNLV